MKIQMLPKSMQANLLAAMVAERMPFGFMEVAFCIGLHSTLVDHVEKVEVPLQIVLSKGLAKIQKME